MNSTPQQASETTSHEPQSPTVASADLPPLLVNITMQDGSNRIVELIDPRGEYIRLVERDGEKAEAIFTPGPIIAHRCAAMVYPRCEVIPGCEAMELKNARICADQYNHHMKIAGSDSSVVLEPVVITRSMDYRHDERTAVLLVEKETGEFEDVAEKYATECEAVEYCRAFNSGGGPRLAIPWPMQRELPAEVL